MTTVHELQLRDAGEIPMGDHDFGLDVIVTPDRVIECPKRTTGGRIHWDELTPEKVESIPLLRAMARGSER